MTKEEDKNAFLIFIHHHQQQHNTNSPKRTTVEGIFVLLACEIEIKMRKLPSTYQSIMSGNESEMKIAMKMNICQMILY